MKKTKAKRKDIKADIRTDIKTSKTNPYRIDLSARTWYNSPILMYGRSYDEMGKEIMSIDACVEDALEKKNHNAIAKLLLSIKPWKNKRFKKCFENILNTRKDKLINGCDTDTELLNIFNQFPVVEPVLWNSYTYEINDLSDKYQVQTVKKWFAGEILPPREVVIQYALWLSLSVEETNHLLISAGHHALYYVDIYDYIAIYYLKKGNGKVKTLEEVRQIKHTMNRYVELLNNEPEYGKKKASDEILQKVQKKSASKGKKKSEIIWFDKDYCELKDGKVTYHPFKGMKIVYPEKIKQHLEHIIENKKADNIMEEAADHVKLVTNYIRTFNLEEISDEKALDEFMRSNIQLFGEVHYWMLQKLDKYMNDVKAYEKNLSDYEGTFDVDDCGELLENKTNSLLILEAEKIREDSRSALKRNIVTRLLAITADDIAEGESIECRAGSFSDIAVLFDGRKKDKKSVYYYNHPSKTMLLRLLAALGKEDEIGTMMIKAGYWDETADWIIHPGAEKSDYLDASDLMIIYMIK